MVGEVEAGTAILLTDHGFLNYCEEELAGCLRPESVGTDLLSDRAERAERRLAELGRKAEQRGGRHMGAVWILPVREKLYGAKGNRAKKRYKWNRNGEDIGLAWISQSCVGGRRQLFPSLSCDRQ